MTSGHVSLDVELQTTYCKLEVMDVARMSYGRTVVEKATLVRDAHFRFPTAHKSTAIVAPRELL